MKTWSEYSLQDGTFTGVTYSVASLEDLALNLKPGMGFFEGTFDALSQRVGAAVPATEVGDLQIALGSDFQMVVDWQPPQPPPDPLIDWSWDAVTKRWLSSPTSAAVAIAVRQERSEKLTACDWTQVADSPLTTEARASWSAYRQALRDISSQPGFPTEVSWPAPPT